MDAIEQDSCVSFVPRGFSPYYVHIARLVLLVSNPTIA
jgi:hypothetical protein